MSHETPENDEVRRFEISKRGINSEQLTEFMSSVARLGWDVHEIIPDRSIVTREKLVDISHEAYGNGVYGESAANLLESMQRSHTGPILDKAGHLRSDGSMGSRRHTGYLGTFLASKSMIMEMLDQNAKEQGYALPFGVSIDYPLPPVPTYLPGADKVGQITAGKVEKDKLGLFAQRAGYTNHSRIGAVGRTLDVLSYAGGAINDIDASRTAVVEPTIEVADLFTTLKATKDNVTKPKLDTLRRKIEFNLDAQLLYPAHEGDMTLIADGLLEFQYYRVTAYKTLITIPSLEAVAQTYSPKVSRMGDYLFEIASLLRDAHDMPTREDEPRTQG